MHLTGVNIEDFRILTHTEVCPDPGLNLLCGANGAGKTSFIEALYVLGRGQSFRHREVRPWIREGAQIARLFVETIDESGKHRVGIEQTRAGRRIRVDGKDVTRRSELVRTIPLQLVTPVSHELIEKGPHVRRKFLDWGLFHVEHDFHQHSLLFKRLINQRNAALKRHDQSFTAWDSQLAKTIEQIEGLRVAFLPELATAINSELESLSQPYRVQMELLANWRDDAGVLQALQRSRARDTASCYTHIGPHRSRIDILVDRIPAEKRLSRGQQKALVYAMMIGLCTLIRRRTSVTPMLLIDDLPAELDKENRKAVVDRLSDLKVQCFVTGIEFDNNAIEQAGKMFHVEQGRVIPID